MLNIFNRDPLKLKFKDFIKRLSKQSSYEYAETFKSRVMDILMRDTSLNYDKIMNMRYEEIDFKVKRVQRQVDDEVKTVTTLLNALQEQDQFGKVDSWFNDPNWQYSVGGDNR